MSILAYSSSPILLILIQIDTRDLCLKASIVHVDKLNYTSGRSNVFVAAFLTQGATKGRVRSSIRKRATEGLFLCLYLHAVPVPSLDKGLYCIVSSFNILSTNRNSYKEEGDANHLCYDTVSLNNN